MATTKHQRLNQAAVDAAVLDALDSLEPSPGVRPGFTTHQIHAAARIVLPCTWGKVLASLQRHKRAGTVRTLSPGYPHRDRMLWVRPEQYQKWLDDRDKKARKAAEARKLLADWFTELLGVKVHPGQVRKYSDTVEVRIPEIDIVKAMTLRNIRTSAEAASSI